MTKAKSPKVSVIICAHNPRLDYLGRVHEALRAQTMNLADWELILVDNRSDLPLADKIDLSWHLHGRHVREDKLGLTPARLKGIAEASGELLVFVDDDNVLEATYLAKAWDIGLSYPFLGAWGGTITPRFETDPPPWTKPYWPYLATRTVTETLWSNDTGNLEFMPIGAGLCIRRSIAKTYEEGLNGDARRRMFGRTGRDGVLGAEDSDLVLSSRTENKGWGLFPQLSLEHLIPPQRLTMDYLVKLRDGAAQSHTMLLCLLGRTPARQPGWKAFANWVKTALLRGSREARFYRAEVRGIAKGLRKWNEAQQT